MVIFVTKAVQPSLIGGIGLPSPNRSLQRPMHAFDLALSLWMTVTAVKELHALPHNPDPQIGNAPGTHAVPPGDAVIDQNGVRQSDRLKRSLQGSAYTVSLRAAEMLQAHQKPAMVIDHRQWSNRKLLIKALRAFEIHLPQFVRGCALEAFHGRAMPVFFVQQFATNQYPM